MSHQPTHEELQDRIKQLEREISKTSTVRKELQESEERLQDLVDNAAVGIYRTTDEGELLLVNRKMAQIFGYTSPHEFLTSVPDLSLLRSLTSIDGPAKAWVTPGKNC